MTDEQIEKIKGSFGVPAVKLADPDTGAKLQGAVKALLEKMQGDLEG